MSNTKKLLCLLILGILTLGGISTASYAAWGGEQQNVRFGGLVLAEYIWDMGDNPPEPGDEITLKGSPVLLAQGGQTSLSFGFTFQNVPNNTPFELFFETIGEHDTLFRMTLFQITYTGNGQPRETIMRDTTNRQLNNILTSVNGIENINARFSLNGGNTIAEFRLVIQAIEPLDFRLDKNVRRL